MSKKLKLDQLVSAIGNENILMQNLDECALEFEMAKHGTHIKFGTDMAFGINGTERLGIVLWFERDAVRAWLDAFKARREGGGDDA